MGGILLMKKMVIIVIVGLILLFPFMRNTYNEFRTPDKVLLVGHQLSDNSFEFPKEIKDQEKIEKFESLFDQVHFTTSEWNEETYPDVVVQINHKEGIFTHPFHIWIYDEEAIALISTDIEKTIGKLSNEQIEELESIIH